MTPQEIIKIATEIKDKYPRAWEHCHDEGEEENDFIILVGQACNRIDRTIGNNWSRAVKDDLARDGLTTQRGGRYFFTDIVANAGKLSIQSITYNETGECPPAGWVDPFMLKTKFNYISGTDPVPVKPPVEPKKRHYETEFGDTKAQAVSKFMFADYKEANGFGLDEGCGTWMAQIMWDMMLGDESGKIYTYEEAVAKHRPTMRKQLGLDKK